MNLPCHDLVSFADGELDPERADAFRSHLSICPACRTALVEALQLGARLGALAPPVRAHDRSSADPQEVHALDPCVLPRARGPRPKRRLAFAWAGATSPALATLAAVAATALFVIQLPGRGAPDGFAALETRPFPVRFAHAEATAYRPTRDEMRGAGKLPRERISQRTLAALERHDPHALAIAMLWNGHDPGDIAEQLSALPPTLPVRSDRAAIEVLTTSADNAEPVLAELEALQGSDDAAVARVARWNYAVMLSRLDLPLSAAQAFRTVADEHEAGWADEARVRASVEQIRGQAVQASWARASEAGEALLDTGAPVPAELVAPFPELIRAYFYEAVRTAPDRQRVLGLAPLAAELDRLGDQSTLSDYIRRVANLDFRRRAPLASAYARLLRDAPLPAAVASELTTPTASADVVDIVMGAMLKLEVAADRIDAYRRMARQTGDPWLEGTLAQAEAAADVQRGNWLAGAARLHKAQRRCSSLAYQCLAVTRQLGTLYRDAHRMPEAATVVRAGLRAARGSRQWGRELDLLCLLADIERRASSRATAGAYANEALLMLPGRRRSSLSSPW